MWVERVILYNKYYTYISPEFALRLQSTQFPSRPSMVDGGGGGKKKGRMKYSV